MQCGRKVGILLVSSNLNSAAVHAGTEILPLVCVPTSYHNGVQEKSTFPVCG